MENDLTGVHEPLGPDSIAQIKSLFDTNFRVSRAKAETWASRDIKFIVSDDDLVFQEKDNLNLQRQSHSSSAAAPHTSSNHQEHKEARSCSICSTVPEFPPSRKTRNFRVFRPRDEIPPEIMSDGSCIHYVAVSYCWPVQPARYEVIAEAEKTCRIRDLDGSVRKNRASNQVLDHAVEVAKSCGLRMIWIDQECLPQPTEGSPLSEEEKDEQTTGVQAMDIVYTRAIVTAGLHDTTTISLRQLKAILEFQAAFGKKRPAASFDKLMCIVNFLESVSKERRYTRAWIAQEGLNAGSNLVLVFHLGPDVPSTFRTPKLLYPDHLRLPEQGLDSDKAGCNLPSSLYMLYADELQTLCRRLVRETAFTFDAAERDGLESDPEVAERFAACRAYVFSVARRTQIRSHMRPQNHRTDAMAPEVEVKGMYREHQKVNAAGALSLLKKCGCRDVQDLIVIMANMCRYDIRLDVSSVMSRCKSVRVAALALAVINGDLSLFVPELYGTSPQHRISLEPSRADSSSALLLQPFDAYAGIIDHQWAQLRPLVRLKFPQRQQSRHRQRRGLYIPAYMWTVDGELDLKTVQSKWSQAWNSLKRLESDVHIVGYETSEAYEKRRDQTECESRAILLAGEIVASQDKQHLLAQVIFAILRHLHDMSDTDKRALGAANSIWHSLRASSVNRDSAKLPKNVRPALFDHPDVLTRPYDTFELDASQDGKFFNQLWFVERIVSRGTLWVGRYNRTTDSIPSEDIVSRDDEVFRQHGQEGDLTDETSSPGASQASPPGAAQGVTETAASSPWTPEAESRRVRELASVFDVDGPCLVATPFDFESEVLPRSKLRSLSACWVVKEEAEANGNTQLGPVDEQRLFRVVDKVMGLWQIMEPPIQEYSFI